ncbi:MAG: lysophospholipid acyltransferase family protein [Oligoflexus sp.]|nr:lysophospholipid acyltransferase family protein [Oligoflexus sp.]
MLRKFKEKLICWIAYLFIGSLYLTYRFRWHGLDAEKHARSIHPHSQVAIAIWHRNSIGCMLAYAWRRLAILVSLSFDGEVIAFVARKFGIHTARGSSSRGGSDAFKQLMKLHREAYDLGITVDGPRGPIYKVKAGIIAAASRTGMPILPFAAVARQEWVLSRAWDKFRVPKPFTEILCLYGDAIVVPKDLESERFDEYAQKVGLALMNLEERLRLAITAGPDAQP